MPGNSSTQASNKNDHAALITGGATRLGLSFAKALAQEGYNIALHYHSSKASAQLAKQEIEAIGVCCELFQADLSSDCPEQLMHNVVDSFPQLEVLINSASAYDAATIADTGRALLQHQFAVNFFAPFMLTQAFTQLLLSKDVSTRRRRSLIFWIIKWPFSKMIMLPTYCRKKHWQNLPDCPLLNMPPMSV